MAAVKAHPVTRAADLIECALLSGVPYGVLLGWIVVVGLWP